MSDNITANTATVTENNVTVQPSRTLQELQAADRTLQLLLNNPDFKVTWNNRRRIVSWTLIFCGAVVTVITLSGCVTLFSERDLQPNVASLFSWLVSSAVFLTTTIIGSYIFGAAFETTKFRDKITELAGTVVTGKKG